MFDLKLLYKTFELLKDEPYIELVCDNLGGLYYRSPSKLIALPMIFGKGKEKRKIKFGFITNNDIKNNLHNLEKYKDFNYEYIIVWLSIVNKKELKLDLFDSQSGEFYGSFNIIFSKYTNKLYYKFYKWFTKIKIKIFGEKERIEWQIK